MKIKEIEERSGMSRANIRFYESEGLLAPERDTNGYRDYSEHDLEALQRIKLLRTLRISLEEIKSIANGQHNLVEALDAHLLTLENESLQVEQAQKLCRLMRDDNVQYASLDAQYYLEYLQSLSTQQSAVWKEDRLPKVKEFERRFFARMLDLVIYGTLWTAVLALVLNINPNRDVPIMETMDTFVGILMMYLLEPILLSKFGTTPGKWLLGLSVWDYDGNLLTLDTARTRTWNALWRGMGLGIPVYDIYRLVKCYWDPDQNFIWEEDSVLILRDKKSWRIVAYIGGWAATVGVTALIFILALVPTYRGDITVKEFCRNYNAYADFYNYGFPDYLDDEGKWKEKDQTGSGTFVLSFRTKPDYQFQCDEDGNIVAIQYAESHKNSEHSLAYGQLEMIFALRSYIGAQKECGVYSSALEDVIQRIAEYPQESFVEELHGVRVIYHIEQNGWTWSENLGFFFPTSDVNSFNMQFTMEKL